MAYELRVVKRRRLARGFTMIELIMVISITGILAATASVFVQPAMTAYFAAKRRASMSGIAEAAFRRIGRDIRASVPNSVRWTGQCLEMVPTSTGGRYREASDTVNSGSTPLLIAQAATGFDVLGTLNTTPALNDWVVIDNQNTNDVYAGNNSAQITAVTVPPTGGSVVGSMTLGFASKQFPASYTGGRFVVVPNNGGNPALMYICSVPSPNIDSNGNGTGALYQLYHPFSAAYPTSCPATTGASLVASNVSYCAFDYSVSEDGTQQSGFAYMQLQITQSSETVSLDYGVHVDNVP